MFDFKEEASGCLNCPNAQCSSACPLNVRIPEINRLISEDKLEEAFEVAFEDNPLGLICGIVCPHERQCEGSCIKGIIDTHLEIGKIEEALWKWKLADTNLEENTTSKEKSSNKKVAIVGGGPAGIACASFLLRNGIDVTIYEKESFLGGILIYGIPDFRLDSELVKKNINYALTKNVKGHLDIKYNSLLVSDDTKVEGYDVVTLASLEKEYDYVFISIGHSSSKTLGLINDSNKEYIINANDFLRNDYDVEGKKVVVIGGGNVAIDSSRKANKNGADTTIIYRRRKEDMPANKKEIEEAIEEGVKFIFTTKVLEANVDDGLVLTLDDNSNFKTDYMIEAIGSSVDKKFFGEDIEFTEDNYVKVDENYKIENRNIFVGGDLTNKNQTVANAVFTGLKVAKRIISDDK
ncbi:MAG: FAD-dependent oxidoreductase [Clostridia bacterium]|nr:FAD-dependent oxidoreductase [Clostridia bacterium]